MSEGVDKVSRRNFLKTALIATAAGTVAVGKKYVLDHPGYLAYKAIESAAGSESAIDLFTDCATAALAQQAKDHFSKDLGIDLEANPELQMIPNIIDEAIKLSGVSEIAYQRDSNRKPAKYY